MENATYKGQPDLGALLSVHRSSRFKQFLILAFGVGGVAFSVFCFVTWVNVKPRQADPAFIFLLGLICMAFSVLLLWGSVRLGEEELRFHEKGLAYRTRTLYHVVPWDQVGSVFEFVLRTSVNGIPSARSFTYSILTKDEDPLVFRSHLTGIKEIGERLKAEAAKRDMPINSGIATDYVNRMLSVIPK